MGGVERVSSVGVECEHEDVALTIGTTIPFRCIHSGDVKSASEKCWLHITFQVSALYGTPRLSGHSSVLHVKQKAQNINTVSFIG